MADIDIKLSIEFQLRLLCILSTEENFMLIPQKINLQFIKQDNSSSMLFSHVGPW